MKQLIAGVLVDDTSSTDSMIIPTDWLTAADSPVDGRTGVHSADWELRKKESDCRLVCTFNSLQFTNSLSH